MIVEAGGQPIGELPDGTIVVEAMALLKVIMPGGHDAYYVQTSPTLSNVEALGMVEHAKMLLAEAIMKTPPN